MKKHGNTHKAPRSSKRQSNNNAQASNGGNSKLNIATADDVGVQDNDRDAGSSTLSDGRGSGGSSKQRRSDRAS